MDPLDHNNRRRCEAACQKLAEAIKELDSCGLDHYATHAQLCLDLVQRAIGSPANLIADYQIEWSRPVPASLPGEHAYHATNGTSHIIVIASDSHILAAERLAQVAREVDSEASIQQIMEDAINRAIADRHLESGELRLRDEDFL